MSVYLHEPHAKRRANEIVFSENQIYLKFNFRSKEQEQTCCNSFLCYGETRRAAGPLGRGGPWAVGRWLLGRGPAFSKTPYLSHNYDKYMSYSDLLKTHGARYIQRQLTGSN